MLQVNKDARRRFRLAVGTLSIMAEILSGCSADQSANPKAFVPLSSVHGKLPGAGSKLKPVGLRVSVQGDAGTIVKPGGLGELTLCDAGCFTRISLKFRNEALSIYEMAPGKYKVIGVGPYGCKNIGFSIPSDVPATALGSLDFSIRKGSVGVSSTLATVDERQKTAAILNVRAGDVSRHHFIDTKNGACRSDLKPDDSLMTPGKVAAGAAVTVLLGAVVIAALVPVAAIAALGSMKH